MTQNNHEQAVYALMSPAIMRAPNDPQLDGTPWPPSEHNIESAKVWATMALAYEQRTANLIAIYALEDGWQLALNRNAGMTHEKWDDVANQIIERLGLR
jgi:hypothetical protein